MSRRKTPGRLSYRGAVAVNRSKQTEESLYAAAHAVNDRVVMREKAQGKAA